MQSIHIAHNFFFCNQLLISASRSFFREIVFIIFILLGMCTGAWAGWREDFDAGLEANRQGNSVMAITLFSQAIDSGDLGPEDLASALNNRGIAHRLKGQYDEAIADYTRALKLMPDFAIAYSNRGLAHSKNGRYDAAIKDLTQSLNKDPHNADTYFKRGNTYSDKGEYNQAIADYSQTIAIKPDIMRAYYYRCDAYDKTGHKDLAIKDCSKAIELDPEFNPARKALEWLIGTQKGDRPCFCSY